MAHMSDCNITVFLIGARGAGKTSVGRLLARTLGCHFYDTDALICDEVGCTVAEIIERFGWDDFRRRESRALVRATRNGCQDGCAGRVVSTGGGMVLDENNRNFMRSSGLVIFLTAPANVLFERLSRSNDVGLRPALTGMGLLPEIQSVLAEREHLYRATAHNCLDASAALPKIVASIVRILHRRMR